MSIPLDPDAIAKLLKEEQEQPTKTRRPKVDPTEDRSINGWFRLAHHICTRACPHRVDENNPTYNPETGEIGRACWNPNCKDNVRDIQTDRGAEIVYEVKGQWICRYCYIGEYLL